MAVTKENLCSQPILFYGEGGGVKKALLLTIIASAMYSAPSLHATTYFDTRALFTSTSTPTQDLVAVNPQGEFVYIRVGTLSQSISATDLYVTFSVPTSNSCARLNGFGSGSFPVNFFVQPFTDAVLQTPLTGNSVDASFGIRALPDGTCVAKFDNLTLPSGSYIVLAFGLLPQFVDRLNPWPLTVTAGGTWESVPPFCPGGTGINNCVAYSGTPYILITDVNPFPEPPPQGTTYLDTRGLFVATSTPAQDLNIVNPTDGGVTEDSSIGLGTILTDIPGQSDYYLNFSAPFPNSCATIVNNLQPSGTSFFNIAYFTSDGAYFLGHDDVAANDIETLPDSTCVAHFRAINVRNAKTLAVLQVRHFDGGYLIPSFPLEMTVGGTWTGPLVPFCGLHCRHYNGTLYAQLSDSIVTLPPALSVSPLAIDFHRQIIGMPSPTKNITIQNSGGGILIPILNVSGDFSQNNNCGPGLSAANTCQITLTFTPTGPAARQGALSISSQSPQLNQQISLSGFGALGFPLKGPTPDSDVGLTAYTAVINTAFDHSMQNKAGEYQIYGCDKTVTDFLGETGNNLPVKVFGCHDGYSQGLKAPFLLSAQYSGGNTLFYDGHPGYDYESKFGNPVFAATAGVVKYPTRQELATEVIAVGGDPDNLQVLELDAAEDLKIFYLHLSTHPRTISVHLKDNLVHQDFEGQSDSSFTPVQFKTTNLQLGSLEISGTVTAAEQPLASANVQLSGMTLGGTCVYEITKTDHSGQYEFDHLAEGFYNLRPIEPGFKFQPASQRITNEGLPVKAGDPIALSGNAGGEPGCFAPHLHFEIQRRTAVSVIDHTDAGPLNLKFIPIDPYGWHPLIFQGDPYFEIPALINVGLRNETLWELTPDPN